MAELGADGALVVAAEAGEFAREAAELAEALVGIFEGAHGLDVDREFGGHDGGDVCGDGDAVAGQVEAEFGGLFGGPAGLFAQELMADPFKVAALAPFGEVLRADGQAGELVGDEFLDFGLLIEPGDDGFGEFAVFEAAV